MQARDRSLQSSNVELVIMTCEGRERLLERTLRSFESRCPFVFSRRILGVDGQVADSTMDVARADVVVQSRARRGYVRNILQVLRQLEGDYFFWLEDDWTFARPLRIDTLQALLASDPRWAQLRLSKTAPLTSAERARSLAPGVFESICGFSANPSLNRTAVVRDAFDWIRRQP